MQTRIIDTRSVGSRPTAVIVADVDVNDLGSWLSEVFGRIAALLDESGNSPVGPPFARYQRLGRKRFRVEAGFPVAHPVTESGEMRGSNLPGGTVAITTHLGPYEDMEATYEALSTWLESRGATASGEPWEVYFSGPSEPRETWRTDIVQPYESA